jgi:hypothetical protein
MSGSDSGTAGRTENSPPAARDTVQMTRTQSLKPPSSSLDTAGLPKGIVHDHGGIVLEQLKSARLYQDVHPG